LEAEYRQEANQIMLEHKAEVENLEKTFEEKLLSVQVSKDQFVGYSFLVTLAFSISVGIVCFMWIVPKSP
jgi:hypothetical protein